MCPGVGREIVSERGVVDAGRPATSEVGGLWWGQVRNGGRTVVQQQKDQVHSTLYSLSFFVQYKTRPCGPGWGMAHSMQREGGSSSHQPASRLLASRLLRHSQHLLVWRHRALLFALGQAVRPRLLLLALVLGAVILWRHTARQRGKRPTASVQLPTCGGPSRIQVAYQALERATGDRALSTDTTIERQVTSGLPAWA